MNKVLFDTLKPRPQMRPGPELANTCDKVRRLMDLIEHEQDPRRIRQLLLQAVGELTDHVVR